MMPYGTGSSGTLVICLCSDCCQHCCLGHSQSSTRDDMPGTSAQSADTPGRSWTTCPELLIRSLGVRSSPPSAPPVSAGHRPDASYSELTLGLVWPYFGLTGLASSEPVCQSYARVTITDAEGTTARGYPPRRRHTLRPHRRTRRLGRLPRHWRAGAPGPGTGRGTKQTLIGLSRPTRLFGPS